MPAIKCKATRTDDAPCRAPALDDGEELCLWHSERWRDVRLANSRKGGLRRTIELPSAEALTPAKARELLAAASSALLSGSLDANTVRSLAYALMVDGGTYNGFTITGIGLTKAGKIQYRALTQYLVSGSKFLDDYLALQQSCTDLTGTADISADDCAEVKKALDAVEMSKTPCT